MRHVLLCLLLLSPLASHAREMPWLILGGGEAEHLETERTSDFLKFGFGIPAHDGTPLGVEVAYWHFDDHAGLSEPQALSLELMPRLDLGALRLFLRGGPTFTRSSAGWSYGGGLEFPLFRATGYRWKLRLDWERFTEYGDLTEQGAVEAATANIIVAH